MAAPGATPIILYHTTTALAQPSTSNLNVGELAINVTDKKVYSKDGGNALITVVGTLGNQDASAAAITGGTINSTTIGATTAATGRFTTLTATGASTLTTINATATAVTSLTASADSSFTSTGALTISKGTTGERPTPVSGMLRFNTTSTEFEGYNGTTWASVGGAGLSNDTTTATNLFPLFSSATSGTASTLFTSNAKYLYKPSTGELQASVLNASNGIVVNSQTVAASYSIPSGSSAMSTGPVTVASGVTVTIPSGSRWVVL
jgi:hypothetical protein